MKEITKYKAVDGTEFNSPQTCTEYEALIDTVKDIMSELPPLPENDGCSFVNGGGFIQHDLIILRHVKHSLLELMKKYIDHEWVQQTIDDDNVHPSWVGRMVDDNRPLRDAWHRIYCTDKLGREWGQPYYVENPDRAKQFCINSPQPAEGK